MKGSQSHEFETDVPASELWEIYGTFRAAELLPELLPHILAKAELVSGDGGVGTIVQLTLPPGIPGQLVNKTSSSAKQMLTVNSILGKHDPGRFQH